MLPALSKVALVLTSIVSAPGTDGSATRHDHLEAVHAGFDGHLTLNTAAVSAEQIRFVLVLVDVSMVSLLRVWCWCCWTVSASGGFVVWSGYSDNSLTARVSAINAGYTTTGDYAVFTTDNTTRYLFVQGGTNDIVARLSDDNQLSAGNASIIRSGNTIGFSS